MDAPQIARIPDMSYRMSYRLSVGPPKEEDALRDDEGLTDHLVICSILGTPGADNATSLAPMLLGPDGAEVLDGPTCVSLAMVLLDLAVQLETLPPPIHAAAARALVALRKPFQR